METLEIFIGELRQLFGLKPSYCSQDMDMSAKFVVSEKGFTECLVWPILKAVLDDIQEAALHLGAYECYFYFQLRSLPRMIVIDEIGKQVELSLEASSLAQRNATLGISDSSAANFRTGFPACAAGGNQRAETLQERAKYSAFLASWAASS
ncbi:hypothetical protein C2845_PM07G31920 [Panicum miliaceum]|uniref:Uncharacterized protein n=1 Tax=Panicum miliaceum TaxID=4540 RepID=A0A3L6SKC7_PANMI|nr:hypothetical protein C2845_PM07G31920 [Panicum miliaceum]